MKRWIAVIAMAGYLWAGAAISFGEGLETKLTFEQVGPSDASLKPFTVELRTGTSFSKDVLVVSPKKFAQVLALIKEANTPKPTTTLYLEGTLRVTSFEGKQFIKAYIIYPDSMLKIIADLLRMVAEQP